MAPAARPIRVVDFSTHLSGPLASQLLVQAGAQVVKVEHPVAGDGNRKTEPYLAGTGFLHATLNAGTRSLAVSTRSPHWAAVVERCAQWADAVIVGARPSDAARRGLDFASVRSANPEIVYCVVSGYGLAGPWADFKAHGQQMDAFAGRVTVEWVDGQPRTPEGWRSAGTTLAGVFAAMGVLAGIVHRDRGGGAQFVHTSIWGAALWWNWRDVAALANLGHPWAEYATLGSRYAIYATADDRALLVCPLEQAFWERFCELADLPEEWRHRGDWSGSMDFGYDDERPLIAERIRRRTLDEWSKVLAEAEIPFAPILTLAEAIDSEHARANAVLLTTDLADGPGRIPASPVQLHTESEDALSLRPARLPAPPDLAADNDAVLADLGLAHLIGEDLSAGTTR